MSTDFGCSALQYLTSPNRILPLILLWKGILNFTGFRFFFAESFTIARIRSISFISASVKVELYSWKIPHKRSAAPFSTDACSVSRRKHCRLPFNHRFLKDRNPNILYLYDVFFFYLPKELTLLSSNGQFSFSIVTRLYCTKLIQQEYNHFLASGAVVANTSLSVSAQPGYNSYSNERLLMLKIRHPN